MSVTSSTRTKDDYGARVVALGEAWVRAIDECERDASAENLSRMKRLEALYDAAQRPDLVSERDDSELATEEERLALTEYNLKRSDDLAEAERLKGLEPLRELEVREICGNTVSQPEIEAAVAKAKEGEEASRMIRACAMAAHQEAQRRYDLARTRTPRRAPARRKNVSPMPSRNRMRNRAPRPATSSATPSSTSNSSNESPPGPKGPADDDPPLPPFWWYGSGSRRWHARHFGPIRSKPRRNRSARLHAYRRRGVA